MAVETERKYLVVGEAWRALATGSEAYRQGYLARSPRGTVRVRREAIGATLTVKSPRRGIIRDEFSYPIPVADADHMLAQLCGGQVLEKVRHQVPHDGMVWHVDVYGGAAAGLVVAEIELERPDQPFSVPPWVGREITDKPRYRNSAIARRLARLARAKAAVRERSSEPRSFRKQRDAQTEAEAAAGPPGGGLSHAPSARA